MRPEILQKYDLRLPRYTSYPTAPHFRDDFTAADYAAWLASLGDDDALSLYVHVPFCESMCWFCGCHTKIASRYQPIADYLQTLRAEMELVAGHLKNRPRVRHLHFGGGSPTIMRPVDLGSLLDHLRSLFAFAPDAEIAVEMDPRTATQDYVQAMVEAGVSRVSMGVQDFTPEVQKAINRIQPFEMTAQVVAWLHQAGIDHINMDLMYGLPLQTLERLLATVDQAVSLGPTRIALFGYAHVPWMKSHQKKIREDDLPGTLERGRHYQKAAHRLRELGYVAIGLDHFARPDDDLAVAQKNGSLQRNFQGYTTDTSTALVGFGASAIGQLPQGYVQNAAPLHHYRDAVAAGRLPVARGLGLNPDDKFRRDIIERLMCDMAVDLEAVSARHQRQASDLRAEVDRLEPMVRDGLVEIAGLKISLTEEGRPLVRAACAVFDRYLKPGEQRHSKAI